MSRGGFAPAAICAVLALGAASFGHGAETPRPGALDARVRSTDYDPSQVVRIAGAWRTASQILFAPDETITHVALGDASGWDVVADGGVLFLKPRAAHGVSDMIVTTRRPGGVTRSYAFELSSGPQGAKGAAHALFVLRFRYPEDLKAAAQAAIEAQQNALSDQIMQLSLEAGSTGGPHNLDYEVQGPAELEPSQITDNGRFTVLRFAGAQPIPAIYQVEPDGSERLAAFDVRGEFVVIHGVAAGFRLRRGNQVLCIYNKHLAEPGAANTSNTAAPDVERLDLGGAGPGPESPGEPGAAQP